MRKRYTFVSKKIKRNTFSWCVLCLSILTRTFSTEDIIRNGSISSGKSPAAGKKNTNGITHTHTRRPRRRTEEEHYLMGEGRKNFDSKKNDSLESREAL